MRKLNGIYVFGLQTLRALFYFKRAACSLVGGFVAAGGDGGKMPENIFAIFALDKPEPFCGVKPLHSTCFFHLFPCLKLLKYQLRVARPILTTSLRFKPM